MVVEAPPSPPQEALPQPFRSGLAPVRHRLTVGPKAVNLYYELHGDEAAELRILLIMGLAATGTAWAPQIREFTAPGSPPCQLCVFDNRGVGKSDAPDGNKHYSTGECPISWMQYILHAHV